jgi:hypothetical protein
MNFQAASGVSPTMVERVLVVLVLALAAGCGSEAPPRVEALVAHVDGSGEYPLYTRETILTGVSPMAELQIRFDRPLSPTRLGGATTEGVQFLDGVVDIVWENAPPGSRKIQVQEVHQSMAPTSGSPGSSVIVLSTAAEMPAGARLRLHLDRARITNADGIPLEGPEDLFVETAPFSVRMAESLVGLITPARLVFNNRAAADIPGHLRVTLQGQPLEVFLTRTGRRQNEYLMLAPGGAWSSDRYEVAVDGGAADDFGQALVAPVTLFFEAH